MEILSLIHALCAVATYSTPYCAVYDWVLGGCMPWNKLVCLPRELTGRNSLHPQFRILIIHCSMLSLLSSDQIVCQKLVDCLDPRKPLSDYQPQELLRLQETAALFPEELKAERGSILHFNLA